MDMLNILIIWTFILSTILMLLIPSYKYLKSDWDVKILDKYTYTESIPYESIWYAASRQLSFKFRERTKTRTKYISRTKYLDDVMQNNITYFVLLLIISTIFYLNTKNITALIILGLSVIWITSSVLIQKYL